MFLRLFVLLVLSMNVGVAAASLPGYDLGKEPQYKLYGEGLPLPWPFPWAEDCPVQWSALSGRYTMLDSESKDEVQLTISIVTDHGFRFLRISRFASDGTFLSDGVTFLARNQRSARVYLNPLDDRQPPLWANIKLYYASEIFSCEMNSLVPILSLIEKQNEKNVETRYRLVRRPRE